MSKDQADNNRTKKNFI